MIKEKVVSELFFQNQKDYLPYTFKNDIHTFIDFPKKNKPTQGWKIHVSCFYNNYKEILEITSTYCTTNKVDFKFINNEAILYSLLSKNANRVSSGKFITIYPNNTNEFKAIISDLYLLLKEFKGPYILTDKRFKDNKVLYYRYGLFVSNEVDPGYIYDSRGNKYIDIEGPFYTKRDFVRDPFTEEDKSDKNGKGKIGIDIHIEGSLQMNNGGGIYKGYVRKDDLPVVIKEARPYIGVTEDLTSIFFRRNERRNLLKLKNCKYVPNIVDYFKEWEHEFLIEEYIEGKTLQNFIYDNTLVTLNYTNKEEIQNRIIKIKKVVLNMLNALDYLHSINFIVNDISPNNIIIDQMNNVSFIDLEDSFFLNEDPLEYVVKNEIFSNRNIDVLDAKSQDKQKLAYLIISIFCSANETLIYDKTGTICKNVFCYFCESYQIADDVRESIIELVENPNKVDLGPLSKRLSKSTWFSDEESKYPRSFVDPKHILKNRSFYSEVSLLEQDVNDSSFSYIEHTLFQKYNLQYFNRSECIAEKERLMTEISMNKKVEINLSTGALHTVRELLFLYHTTQDGTILNHIKDLILAIDSQSLSSLNGKMLPNSDTSLSPYVEHTAGFIKVCILFSKYCYDESVLKIIKEYIKAIDNDFPKNISYGFGLSGIADTFLDAYELLKDPIYLESSIRKYNVLLLYAKKEQYNDYSFPSGDFKSNSNEFAKGTQGVLYYILHLAYVLNKY